MKHKILTFALALLTAASAGAYDFKVDGLCYNILSSTEVEVTYEQYNGTDATYPSLSGSVNIPASVTYENNEYNVTGIGYNAFAYCNAITSVNIPIGIIYIGDGAFNMCQQLNEINMLSTYPPSITSSTFVGISSSVTVNVPEGSENDYQADSNWKALFDMASGEVSGTCGDNLTWKLTFADSTFTISGNGNMYSYLGETPWNAYRSYYHTLNLPEGLTVIGGYAFYNCFNLKKVTIPSNVERIEDQAFVACYNLSEIIWNASVCNQAWNIFDESPIRTVTFGESVQSIPDAAFTDISTLTAINVLATNPPAITSSTFRGINTSATISVPESSREAYLADPNWKRLLDMASGEISGTFGENQNLTWTLTFADSTLTISGTGGMGYINEYESWQPFSSSVAKVVIEEGVTSIASGAFRYHSNLRSATIPSSVTHIELGAFSETALYNNEAYWTNSSLYIDNCLIGTKDISGHYEITDGTRVIAGGALQGNHNLTSVTIPNSVTIIDEQAFYLCDQLTQVTIPAAAKEIGFMAFSECSSLTSITVLATIPPVITTSTFEGIKPSVRVTVPESSKAAYMADKKWKRLLELSSGKISGTIGSEQNLTWTLTFADSTITLSGTGEMDYISDEDSWEIYSSYIAKAIIEEGVTSINGSAFDFHDNLRSVTIPNSVTHIGSGAFSGSALSYDENNWANGGLYIDHCLVTTNYEQIAETGNFTVIEGTRLIADRILSNNTSLTSITIPNSVTHIGNNILERCENLTSIHVLAVTPPVITPSTFEGVNAGIQVSIPEGSTALYEADTNWKNFLQFCSGIISGTCGANLTWTLTLADNTLTISGTGDMYNYLWGANPLPWEQYRSYINTVNIAEGVTSISGGAFSNSNLNSINIPNSINKIGESAFVGTQLYYDDSNWSNGALYIDNCLIAANSEAIGNYAIAEGTRIIADAAFNSYYEYDLLTGISLPNSVTHIGKSAFYNRNITKVTIGSGTQSIGEDAFSWCENLSEINIAATTPPVIAANTFQYISTDLQITVPEGSESLYLADPNWKRLFDIASGVVEGICGENLTWVLNMKDSTLTISGYGDMDNYNIWSDDNYVPMPWEEFRPNIKTVILPDGITSVGDFAFISDYEILTTVNLPEGIRRIGKYAFAGNALTSVSIPASVELIDTAAFSNNVKLSAFHVNADNRYYTAENGVLFNKDKSTLIAYPIKKQDTQYNVPSSVNTIDYAAFWWCETLTSIILPEGLTKINSNAFGSCTQLAEINIPNSVNYIGEYAFDGTAIYEDESNWTEGVLYWDNCLIATDYENYSENYTILNGTRLIAGGTFPSDKLKSITIPATVICIGENAFNWCNNLKEITVLAENPPMLGANVFEEVNRNIPLYVPAGSLESYRNAAVWNEFRVQSIPSTDLQTPATDGFESLTISNSTLHNPEGLSISIFDMHGRLIYNGTGTTVHMSTGIYIVRIGYSSQKMFIP